MKEFEVTIQLRNNRLKQRRLELGASQKRFAETVGVCINAYAALERMSASPLARTGGWSETALLLADFYCVEPKELFPQAVVQVTQARAVKRLSADELGLFLGAGSFPVLPEDTHAEAEGRGAVLAVVNTLTKREVFVLSRLFGLAGTEEATEAVLAQQMDCSTNRISQIKQKALRKLRHPSRSDVLRAVKFGDVTDAQAKRILAPLREAAAKEARRRRYVKRRAELARVLAEGAALREQRLARKAASAAGKAGV